MFSLTRSILTAIALLAWTSSACAAPLTELTLPSPSELVVVAEGEESAPWQPEPDSQTSSLPVEPSPTSMFTEETVLEEIAGSVSTPLVDSGSFDTDLTCAQSVDLDSALLRISASQHPETGGAIMALLDTGLSTSAVLRAIQALGFNLAPLSYDDLIPLECQTELAADDPMLPECSVALWSDRYYQCGKQKTEEACKSILVKYMGNEWNECTWFPEKNRCAPRAEIDASAYCDLNKPCHKVSLDADPKAELAQIAKQCRIRKPVPVFSHGAPEDGVRLLDLAIVCRISLDAVMCSPFNDLNKALAKAEELKASLGEGEVVAVSANQTISTPASGGSSRVIITIVGGKSGKVSVRAAACDFHQPSCPKTDDAVWCEDYASADVRQGINPDSWFWGCKKCNQNCTDKNFCSWSKRSFKECCDRWVALKGPAIHCLTSTKPSEPAYRNNDLACCSKKTADGGTVLSYEPVFACAEAQGIILSGQDGASASFDECVRRMEVCCISDDLKVSLTALRDCNSFPYRGSDYKTHCQNFDPTAKSCCELHRELDDDDGYSYTRWTHPHTCQRSIGTVITNSDLTVVKDAAACAELVSVCCELPDPKAAGATLQKLTSKRECEAKKGVILEPPKRPVVNRCGTKF